MSTSKSESLIQKSVFVYEPVCDVLFKRCVFPRSFPTSLLSDELLGMHETIQRYYKFKLVVPLRLLRFNNLKHRLTRDVSQFKLLLRSHLQYRSFTKKAGQTSVLKCCFHTHLCLAPCQLVIIRAIVAVKTSTLSSRLCSVYTSRHG